MLQLTDDTDWMAYTDRGLSIVAIAAAALTALRFGIDREDRASELYVESGHCLLEEKNRQLEQYMFIASHNLNEPLQTINSFVDVIKEDHRDAMSDELKRYFGFVDDATTKMRCMVKGLVAFSRTGHDQPFRRVDLNEVCSLAIYDLGDLTRQTRARFRISPLPTVTGMPTELRQLLRELFRNALKFQPAASRPLVTLSYEEHDFEWLFYVADNGIGLDEEERNNVFGMFVKLHRAEEYPGLGIGLALCAKIVDLHMGKVWIEGDPGGGSRVCFTIMKSPVLLNS